MCIWGEIIFIYKLLWNVFKADSDILWSVHQRGQVKIADVKSDKAGMAAGEYAVDDNFDKFGRSCRCVDVPGVVASISSNSDSCSVGSSLWALYLHTTLVYVILLRRSWGISSCWIIRNVSVPSTRYCLGPLEPLPMPWHMRPSSLEYAWFQVFLYLGWRHSCRCSRVSPATVSITGMAQFWMNTLGESSMGCLPGAYVNLLSELLGVDFRTCSSSD